MAAVTETPAQLPLDLGHRPAMGEDDFLVASSNEAAVAWLDLWPNWPAPALVIFGPSRLRQDPSGAGLACPDACAESILPT